jgi:hypothetical protein
MIDFIVGFFAVIFFLVFYAYIGYWFLDLRTLPEEHWVSRSANQVRLFFGTIWEPMRSKTRRLDVRLLLVLDNLVMRLTNTDYILLSKKLWAHLVCLYLKMALFVLKLKRLFFEKNENKR